MISIINLLFTSIILLGTVSSDDNGKQFVRGIGHGSISKVSMASLTSTEVDDVFGDIKTDENQYSEQNRDVKNGDMIDLTVEEVTVGPLKIIKPNIIHPTNVIANKEIEASLLNLSGSHKLISTTPKIWNRPALLKTSIMPHSVVEKKNTQEVPENNDDLTDDEVSELTKYVEKYISNANFRQYVKNNLQTETLFVAEPSFIQKTIKKVLPSTTTMTSTTTTKFNSPVNKSLNNKAVSKEKLKQFKDEFNKWLEELRKKASNVSRGIEVKDSLNSTINEAFVLKANSTILLESFLEKMPSTSIKILQKGFFNTFTKPGISNKKFINMSSTITLIQDMGKNILIDTGLSSNDVSGKNSTRIEILRKLNELLLSPNDIHYVVITCPHLDHTGNLNEFGNAIIFQNNFIFDQSKSTFTTMNIKTSDYFITPNVKITKGYGENMYVIVKKSKNFKGIVSITGDLFINQYDIFNPSLWKPFSSDVEAQEFFRKKIICSTNWVIPGHDDIFKVDTKFKKRFC